METEVLFIVFISIFSITALITLLGITNVIKGIKEKYLTVLFSSLIVEVVAAIILLFNTSVINGEKIPEDFYEAITENATENVEKDKLTLIALLKKGKKCDDEVSSRETTIAELTQAKKELNGQITDLKRYSNSFYVSTLRLDELRRDLNHSINLKYESKNEEKQLKKQEALKIVNELLFVIERLESEESTKNEIIAAFKKFKSDNHRSTEKEAAHSVYLQDVPLFIKAFLEKKYDLNLTIYAEKSQLNLTE